MNTASIAAPESAQDDPITAVMLGDGYDLDRMRSEHTDDGTGHCRVCGGPQSGRYTWPCATALAVERASRIRQERSPNTNLSPASDTPGVAGPGYGHGVDRSSYAREQPTVIESITDRTR